jgi:methyltransferase family protein
VGDPIDPWLHALDARHLATLTPSEVARALRALSSCYVERRAKLTSGAALDTAGKRAAFALFYGPLHFLVVHEIVRSLGSVFAAVREIVDLGCGTGSAGAAWAITCGARLTGIDRHPWAVDEANRTYRELGVRGRATQGDVTRVHINGRERLGILAAYSVNELADQPRVGLMTTLLDAHAAGARVLIVEPISRRVNRWWDTWQRGFEEAGGRADEWRFPANLPRRQQDLARAAGLDPRELTARTLLL